MKKKSKGEDEYACSNMIEPQPVNQDDSGLVKLPEEHQQRIIIDDYSEYPEYPVHNQGR